jgi:hypothetical protein
MKHLRLFSVVVLVIMVVVVLKSAQACLGSMK